MPASYMQNDREMNGGEKRVVWVKSIRTKTLRRGKGGRELTLS